MSEALKCDICGAPATIHMTQIIGGKMRKVHLCEKCAAKHNSGQMPIIKFAEMITKKLFGEKLGKEILSGAVQKFAEDEFKGGKKCPQCGTTEGELQKFERFGCPNCYFVFADELNAVLPKIQHAKAQDSTTSQSVAGTEEKTHGSAKGKADSELSLEALETLLKEAVAKEDYALAAKTRDQIAELKNRKPQRRRASKKSANVSEEAEKPVAGKRRKAAAAANKTTNKKGKKQ